jgi:hypothetical protein
MNGNETKAFLFVVILNTFIFGMQFKRGLNSFYERPSIIIGELLICALLYYTLLFTSSEKKRKKR